MSLHVPSFGGGVVRLGAPDAQQTDELLVGDSLDIGPRGQLVCTTDASAYLTLFDLQGVPAAWSRVYALASIQYGGGVHTIALGEGKDVTPTLQSFMATFDRESGIAAVPQVVAPTLTTGLVGMVVQLPGKFQMPIPAALGALGDVILLNFGAREVDYPNVAPGLYVFHVGAGSRLLPISAYSALGDGTASKQLYPRGIVAFNNMVFAWGFDAADATNGHGPNRVMFCNLGTPLKWGNDNQAPTTTANRAFTDSDAIVLGDAGEVIRAALKWRGRLYFGTNQQLHYIGGYGRDSLITDGATPLLKSYNVVGPKAMIEGPDGLMYGVCDQGLWSFDGSTINPLFKRLTDYAGHSTGYWDLMWTNAALAAGYPGRTNQDLVWMAVDWDREQVVVGIPFCNVNVGGAGTQTVLIKYHPRTGGFTRQILSAANVTAAAYLRREGQQREAKFLGTATGGQATVQRYGYQAAATDAPALPSILPTVEFGPYAPFGPDGSGVVRRAYLTLAWESAAGSLPLVFTITVQVDESQTDRFTLSVQPTAPVAPTIGDLWLDTSQSDTNLGNTASGTLVLGIGGYLTKTWTSRGTWQLVPGSGEQGPRARIPMPVTRRNGTRVTIIAQCTAAAGRFQWEGLGLNPGAGSHDA